MAEHGYARDYDEPVDRGNDDRLERSVDRERGWRAGDEGVREDHGADRNFMLGERERSRQPSWLGGRGGEYGFFRDRGTRDRFSSLDQGRLTGRSRDDFSSQQDDHYRSWRNRQMEALDRDYADYCREREQQFHRDFDSWREKRSGKKRNPQISAEEVMELDDSARLSTQPQSEPEPVAEATLGTNNRENVEPGRR